MKRLIVVLTALPALLTGCGIVTVEQPIGEPVTEDLSDELDGAWREASGEPSRTRLRLKWKGNGTLAVEATEAQEKQREVALRGGVLVTELEGQRFVHIPADFEPGSDSLKINRWHVLRAQHKGDAILLALPRSKVFGRAVEESELAGEIGQRVWLAPPDEPEKKAELGMFNVRLTAEKESLDRFIGSQPVEELFGVENPLILIRRGDGAEVE